LGLRTDITRYAVGREHDDGALWGFVELVYEYGPFGSQVLHDITIVDDLVAHIDGRAVQLEGPLDDIDGTVYAGAKTARLRQYDLGLAGNRRSIGRCHQSTPSRATSRRRSAPARGWL